MSGGKFGNDKFDCGVEEWKEPGPSKAYTVDYAFDGCGYKWIVFKNISYFIREKYQVCEGKQSADKLAERLNDGEVE